MNSKELEPGNADSPHDVDREAMLTLIVEQVHGMPQPADDIYSPYWEEGFELNPYKLVDKLIAAGFTKIPLAVVPNNADEIRSAKREAWAEGAKWAAVECEIIPNENVSWLGPGDNPYGDN